MTEGAAPIDVWRRHEAAFYDGLTARRRAVTLRFREGALDLVEDGRTVAVWPYAAIRRREGEPGAARFHATAGPDLARLEIADRTLEEELLVRCRRLDEGPRTAGAGRIVAWSLAAVASLGLTLVYGVPYLADRAAPLVPVSVEARIGEAVNRQVGALFGSKTCTGREGAAALARMTDRLLARADMPMPVQVSVLASPIPNAVALPGGRIYVFEGLLAKARGPDEVAGVLAHELGHVANRDGMRRLIQAGGTSFLLGLLFGDVSGSGALVLLGDGLLTNAYSREAESRADAFAAEVMLGLGRSPRPMGEFLVRLTGEGERGTRGGLPALLESHPRSRERLEALSAREGPSSGTPLLDDGEWRALVGICKAG